MGDHTFVLWLATLAYTMGGSPSGWGTAAANVPPSFNDGFTPPPPAPSLGTNLAQGRPATGSRCWS